MLKRYLLVILTAALCVSVVKEAHAQSNDWNAPTEVVNVLIVDDPRRVLQSAAEGSLEEEITAWLEMAHRPAYIVVANTGSGRVVEIPGGEWDESDKVDLAVETINTAARSPTTSPTYMDRVNGIRRKHLRKAAGQLDLRISVWGRQSLLGPQASPDEERANDQTTDSMTVRARPPAYTPPVWDTVLGWWGCFILIFGGAVGGIAGVVRLFGWVREWKARTANNPNRRAPLHEVSTAGEEARRKDRPSANEWSFTPERGREGPNRSSSSNNTSDKTMHRNFRRFTQNGWALLVGAILIFAQLVSMDARAESATGTTVASPGLPHADFLSVIEKTSPRVQEETDIDRILVLDASGSVYDRSIQVARDRLIGWTNQGFRTRVYALGDHLIEVGDVPPGTSSSAVRRLLNDVERTQHTRLAESLIDLHNRVQKLRSGGERPLVWIASDFVEDTEFAGMSALSFSSQDTSRSATSGEANADSTGATQAGGHRGTGQIPCWWAIAGGLAGILASSLVWGIAWRRRDDALGNSILDRVEIVMPTNADKETHSARSLLRQGSVPIPDDLPPSEVKVETSEDEPGTVSVVLAPSAVPDGEVEGSSDETRSAPQRARAETERSPFSWEPTH